MKFDETFSAIEDGYSVCMRVLVMCDTNTCRRFGQRKLHRNGDDGNPADSAGFPQGWKLCCRVPVGMEANVAGVPREWKYNFAELPRECLFILPYNALL